MPAINNHYLIKQINGPIESGFAVTPDDNNDLTYQTRYLYAGVSGDVKATLAHDGSTVVFKSLAAGVLHPIAVSRVWATGTTATNILGLY